MSKLNVYEEDSIYIAKCNSISWEQLNNTTILVTGATGLIGSTLIRGILKHNELFESKIFIIALSRNKDKYSMAFNGYEDNQYLSALFGDICDVELGDRKIDYIVHGASITASQSFVTNPVETIETAIFGTRHILDIARKKQVKDFVFLSSMEVYGTPKEGQIITEDQMGYLDPLSVRSSYSESKRLCENLCVSYVSEYAVPIKIVRLTQSFGPGIAMDDKRVFAEFARCIIGGKDIVLLTKGETKRMYLYTADAATAILTILTKGQNGVAYNAANMNTYCSVADMANMLVSSLGVNGQKVIINEHSDLDRGFNPTQQVYLDVSKLTELGWESNIDLIKMFQRMIDGMEKNIDECDVRF